MKYQELSREITQRHFSPVYLFTGPENHIALMMEKKLLNAAVPEALAQLNTMVFSEQETDIDDIIAICQQFPMMSDYRTVVIKESTGILKSADSTTIDALCRYIENPSPSTILIIYDSVPDKRKKIWKVLSKKATIVEFSKLTQPELEKWIARRLKLAGKKIRRSVVEQFIENTCYLTNESQTTEIIDNELDKIINYIGEKEEITMSVLNEVMPRSVDDNVFRMMDCIMEDKMDIAIEMLAQFYLEGESPFGIFGLLISQLRTLLHIQILSEKRMPQADIAKAVGRPPFVVKKMQITLRRFSKEHLIRLIERAAKTDLDMKTGKIEPESGLTLFVLGMKR